ncbi:hypothetical protein KQH65_09495 [archaeon]|nr:hypothetical protein [archaeon]
MNETPSFMELAEQADLIIIGKVTSFKEYEIITVTKFQVSEYIKEWKGASPEFTLTQKGGTILFVSPASPTFNIGDEHLLFLMEKEETNLRNDEKTYYLLFDHFGKPLMRDVDIDSLNTVRELYGSTEVARGGREKTLLYPPVYLLISVLAVILIIGIIYGRTKYLFH